MSKGWESKSVEQQQAEAQEARVSRTAAVITSRSDADNKRRVQALEMQRERVLSERTSSPHRRSALELALATIERDLQELGWSIKL